MENRGAGPGDDPRSGWGSQLSEDRAYVRGDQIGWSHREEIKQPDSRPHDRGPRSSVRRMRDSAHRGYLARDRPGVTGQGPTVRQRESGLGEAPLRPRWRTREICMRARHGREAYFIVGEGVRQLGANGNAETVRPTTLQSTVQFLFSRFVGIRSSRPVRRRHWRRSQWR